MGIPRFRHGWVHTLVALAVVMTAAGAALFVRFDGEITGFFWLGSTRPLSPYLNEDSARVNEGSSGYDGQMFLTIALDPALGHPGTLAALDNPRYRYRRIGYPLLGHLVALGRPAAVPWALVLINVLSAVSIVFFGTAIARTRDSTTRRWSSPLLLLGVPGVWVALFLSTADLLASALLVAGLLAIRTSKDGLAAVVLGAACFVRETYLASLLALSIFQYLRGKRRAAYGLAVAAVPSLLWMLYVRLTVESGTGGLRENLGAPFVGIFETFAMTLKKGLSAANLLELYCFGLLLSATFVVGADAWSTRRRLSPENVSVLPLLALILVSRSQVLEYHGGYLRAFLPVLLVPILTAPAGGFAAGKKAVILLELLGSSVYVLNLIFS